MADRQFETLSLHTEGHIAELRLTQPDRLNRVDDLAHEEILEALLELKTKQQLRAVILAADGRAFSAGGDIEELARLRASFSHRQKMFREGKEIIQAILEIPAPIIAAIQGDAIGLGSSLVTACDLAVICKEARIIDPHVAVGLVAGDGGSLTWPQSIGMMRAKRYLLTGQPVSGELAFEMGLVSDLVDTAAEVYPAAQKLAEQIAALAPLAVQGTKKTINKALKVHMEEVLEYGFNLEEKSMVADDAGEALAAFREKRKPVYKGE